MLSLFFFLACSEENLGKFSGDVVYISFTKDASKDSIVYSFQTYPSGEIIADVPVRIRGHWLTEARAFTVSVEPDSTDLPATAYELPEKCEFTPGQELDTIKIKFLNNFEDLKNKSYRLFLRIDESETVKQGEYAYRVAKFYVSDKLEKPIWWSRNDGTENRPYNVVEEVYLGKYSEDKYKLFLDRLEEDNASFDGEDMMVLKKYALRLKYWIEDFNNDPENIAAGKTPMWDNENNEPMRVRVAG
jgi:hypothetical protein